MPTYDVTVTIGFRIEADSRETAREYARSLRHSFNEASCFSISGGNGSAIRSTVPKVSQPKLTDKPMPEYPAILRG